ncbi:transmembrane protein 131 isoform X2 [Rhodnius prolixus]|uniref:transmembrane protein 131 isoform X2 n=1 Tax=Rhodnius prolixus TaxID=13249 RepID=UPI003D1885D8
MAVKLFYCYGSLIIFLDIVIKSHLSSNSNSHSFYSSSEDVRYLVDTIPSMHKDFTGTSEIKIQNIIDEPLYSSKNNLRFHPSVLDFKARHLGVPHHEKVTVINTSCNKTVYMSSISGNTVHFHSSFFQDKVIPPLGNTTFNVVFLGRGEGRIESHLFIHTSDGSFKYIVRGESIGSPYRLRPFSGIRLPLNASYTPLILMHNPHSTPLQLMEVYSSGGEFHLELPSGELEGPKHIWNIPAFLTKPIIRLKFHATTQKNHTAYIRLKVDKSGETLVIPVDVEVGPVCGLYSPDDLIDFGIGGTQDLPKEVKIYLKNSWKKPIRVQNVIAMPVSKALKIDFQPVKVPPDVSHSTQVAVLTFDWKLAHETGQTSGRVVIKSGQAGHKLMLTYTARVLTGGLQVGRSEARFMSESGRIKSQSVNLTNNYNMPIAITNATLHATAKFYFQIHDFLPTIILAGETKSVLQIGVRGESLPSHLRLQTTLFIYTNVSMISIPILCYDGKLNKVIPSETNDTELYLGTVGCGNVKTVYFALVNENPVSIQLQDVSVNMTGAQVRVVAVKKGNVTLETLSRVLEKFNASLKAPYIGPGHHCILELSVEAGYDPGHVQGSICVTTDHELITIPVFMRVEHGSLTIVTDPVQFVDCFPSAVCTAEVRVESKFGLGMAITGVTSIPHQPRLGFVPTSPPLIPPFSNTLLGHLTWDMSGVESYLSSSTNSTGGENWLSTLSLGSESLELDMGLLRSRYGRYEAWSSVPTSVSLRLDTTEVRGLSFSATVSPGWPSLSPHTFLNLPLTRVGDTSVANLTLTNPASSQSVLVQLVLGHDYPSPALLLHVLPPSLRPSSNRSYENILDDSEDVFDISVDGEVTIPTGTEPHKKSKTFMLPPLSNVSVNVHFKPVRAHLTSSILIIRNNLTILEVVELIGSGAYVQFKFGNRKPGSSTPLLFELVDKHLKECEGLEDKDQNHPPNLTVKRSFTARNTGVLPLTITDFSINGQQCQGYGFRILNCQPFHLPANSSKKIEIAFTPDFTLSRVSRLLSIVTSDMAANYTLMATLPPLLLGACSGIIERPAWEPIVYYSSVTFMMALLVCVLTAAVFESNRILRDTFIALSRDHNIQPILDLRLVGAEINDSLDLSDQRGENQPKMHWESTPDIDNEGSKENQKSLDSNNIIHCNSKYQLTNSILNKKKSERGLSVKRLNEINDCSSDKLLWDGACSRSSSSQYTKAAKTGICITTEPYTPLANIKAARDNSQSKSESSIKNKSDQNHRLTEVGSKKQKKKNNSNTVNHEENRKKSAETVFNQNALEEADSSSTSTESSSNDDGGKEVESMFFRTVRHHLETKSNGGNLRPILRSFKSTKNGVEMSPKCLRKSTTSLATNSSEKGRCSSADHDWDLEEDDSIAKAVLVKNNRRINSTKPAKKQLSNCISKIRTEPVQCKGKPVTMPDRVKSLSKKDKGQVSKKKTSNYEKNIPVSKGNTSEGTPPPPPPPIWTTSFSDVVQRSESTYSSVVSLRSNQNVQQGNNTPPHHPRQSTSSPPDKTAVSFSKNGKEYCSEWQPEYKEAVSDHSSKATECASSQSGSGTIGTKRHTNAWSTWASIAETIQCQAVVHQSENSLFTDSNPCVPKSNANYDQSLWSDLGNLKIDDAQRSVPHSEVNQSFNTANDRRNWPIMPSLWQPLYTPSTVENTAPVWGSDVWGPPAPSTPSQGDMPQPTMEYDPFRSLSNIWSQHSTNIWKPPPSD